MSVPEDKLTGAEREIDLLVREAHAVMRDLRSVMKEARTVMAEVRDVAKGVTKDSIEGACAKEFERLLPEINDVLDKAVAHTLKEFRKIDRVVKQEASDVQRLLRSPATRLTSSTLIPPHMLAMGLHRKKVAVEDEIARLDDELAAAEAAAAEGHIEGDE